ncbi:hypothetical protein BAY59_10620 [Prauserella coralliicola]|nr:hypothetical protein BAY59_10620 [Prauserella coralliicola]
MGVMSLFTEPLERVASDGSISPNLATEVSQPDDTTIVYTLREGVRFSNGDPLTADDVVWSLQHVSDAQSGAQTSTIVESVESVRKTGPLEVTVKLSAPDPAIRTNLALVSYIQNAEFATANAEDLGTPAAVSIGTGPYQVTEYRTDSITLTRNPNYWGTEPVPDKVAVDIIPTANTAQLAMRSGEIQGALVDDAASMPQWEGVSNTTVYGEPQLRANYYCLDTTVAPFNDVHVRRAIAHAMDRKGLLEAAFGKYGSVLASVAPPETLAPVAPSADAVTKFLGELPSYDFNLDKARSELARSAYPDGFSVTVPYITGEPWSKLTVLNLRQNLRPLGVTINPKAMTRQEWVDGLFSHDTTPIWPMGLVFPAPDPGQLTRLVTKEAMTVPGGYNFAKWAPAHVREAAATLESSTEPDSRWRAAQTILSAMAKDVPYVPLFQPQHITVLGDGFGFSSPPGVLEMASGAWISDLELK